VGGWYAEADRSVDHMTSPTPLTHLHTHVHPPPPNPNPSTHTHTHTHTNKQASALRILLTVRASYPDLLWRDLVRLGFDRHLAFLLLTRR
jgi:hypothetical protein